MSRDLRRGASLLLLMALGCTPYPMADAPHAVLLDRIQVDEKHATSMRQVDVIAVDGAPTPAPAFNPAEFLLLVPPGTLVQDRPLVLTPGLHTVTVVSANCHFPIPFMPSCGAPTLGRADLRFDAAALVTYRLQSAQVDQTVSVWIENEATKEVVAQATIIAPSPR